MKKCPYSAEREQILAEAISPVASELRLLDAADLISLLRFECYGSISDLVLSAAELYFLPGTVNFGLGGDYKLEWGGPAEVSIDLEIKPVGITVYAKLALTEHHAGVEINHIAFDDPSSDPDENTALLAQRLSQARYTMPEPQAMSA